MNKEIFTKASQNISTNTPSWLATVTNTDGSTPAKIGMKVLVTLEDLTGTIGGGNVEKVTIDRIRIEQPTKTCKWRFDLDGNNHDNNNDAQKIGMICGGLQEIMVEPLFNSLNLYIIGGGHCGQALSPLAAQCGFAVTIIDDRPEVATYDNHPHATNIICCKYDEIENHIKFNDNAYIVAMTHGHKHDRLIMEKVLGKNYKYFGVIGSRKKIATTFETLLEKGFDQKQLDTIFAPIGYPIGSQTPIEVAISIMAQLIAVRNDRI